MNAYEEIVARHSCSCKMTLVGTFFGPISPGVTWQDGRALYYALRQNAEARDKVMTALAEGPPPPER